MSLHSYLPIKQRDSYTSLYKPKQEQSLVTGNEYNAFPNKAGEVESGRPKGMTEPEQKMVGGVIGAVGDIGSSISEGQLNSKENDRLRNEAKGLAQQNRQDTLNSRAQEISVKNKSQDIQDKAFEIQKKKDIYDQKFNRFIINLQRSIESDNNLRSTAENLFGNPERANAIQQYMLNRKRSA